METEIVSEGISSCFCQHEEGTMEAVCEINQFVSHAVFFVVATLQNGVC